MKNRFLEKIEGMFLNIKWFLQKIFKSHHCSDIDLINFNDYLADIIYKKLKAFKNAWLKGNYSYPVGLENSEKWIEIMNKMVFSFELTIKNKDIMNKLEFKKYKEGMNLFAKYFLALWL